jgi:hypothetical protein
MEFALPKAGWHLGDLEPRPDETQQPMKLNFALDDTRLDKEGITGTFVLPATKVHLYQMEVAGEGDLSINFQVVLKKLNLRDAFFNGLPLEWKENLKSLKMVKLN